MGNNDNGGSFALGLLVGGIIGALIGMLLAPKPGAETRSEIWERSETLRSRADEAAA
ncbi:MAG TPA: YtxH domain-containing protein, partial [Dehalococcoidia bacterium]|nr:YtxH domain-containing protein [Dehalococcoidia bacterium]